MARYAKPPRHCLVCGLTEAEAGSPISHSGYCRECGYKRMLDGYRQMREKKGPLYRKWRKNIISGIEKAK